VEDARRRGWEGPLERLLELDALPAGSILAHGVHLDAVQVRRAADAGLWIVQNPRSNRGNRVGYPRHLGQSPRVALGTDGYPSDLAEEGRVLMEEAVRHGEPAAAAAGRAAAGHELVARRFGMQFPGAARAPADLAAVREAARTEAPRLWKRMAALA
jgi:cytosine/adenosine deaminase-related metal-dependent hydrolase